MPNTEQALANPGLLGRVLEWVRAHAQPGSDVANLSREELGRMASDLSLAETDLVSISATTRDNTVLMERMMRVRGLDPDAIRSASGVLLRDIERVCTQCRHSGRCRRELDNGTAALHCHEYCPNATTFDELAEPAGNPAITHL